MIRITGFRIQTDDTIRFSRFRLWRLILVRRKRFNDGLRLNLCGRMG